MGVKGNSAIKNRPDPYASIVSAGIAVIASIVIIAFGNNALATQPLQNDPHSKAIIIDPGHGGRDIGAVGVAGTMEKTVNLDVATELTLYLESRHYKVNLTRSGDYNVPLRNRTAVANHAKANMFISIHTAANRSHRASGIIIYTHQPIQSQPTDQGIQERDNPAQPRAWNRIQEIHETKSRHLADIIYQEFKKSRTVKQSMAPLVVLEGADMPAVLVEIGHLTHSETEKKLSEQTYLKSIAQTLGRAIETYFTKIYGQATQ